MHLPRTVHTPSERPTDSIQTRHSHHPEQLQTPSRHHSSILQTPTSDPSDIPQRPIKFCHSGEGSYSLDDMDILHSIGGVDIFVVTEGKQQ